MQFRLYKIGGYSDSIISMWMSKGKFYNWEKVLKISELEGRITDHRGFMLPDWQAYLNHNFTDLIRQPNEWAQENYAKDREEFERRLNIVMEHAMYKEDHHTLMKYIDFSFVTDGLHRGAQDDLDAHAMGFNNRITRFSTRLAKIDTMKLSEWYEDKVLPFSDAHELLGVDLPAVIETEKGKFHWTVFGYIHEQYHNKSHENGEFKDVQRGLIHLGYPGPALWKVDLFNFRYIYFRRSKLTKANPELKIGIEQLADQLEQHLPVFGPYIRKVYTDDHVWTHMNRTRTISLDLYRKLEADPNYKDALTKPTGEERD